MDALAASLSQNAQSAQSTQPCLLVVGMAAAGKTTLVQRLKLGEDAPGRAEGAEAPYVVNLDPAVLSLPYTPDIDIRDSLDYKGLLQKHGWGPNGGILACLNIFASKVDVLGEALGRHSSAPCFVVDTPGQIECFTWSASGEILGRYLSGSYPTCILYVLDAERCRDPTIFSSSMIYACSILYRFDMPMLIVFNKADLLMEAERAEAFADDTEGGAPAGGATASPEAPQPDGLDLRADGLPARPSAYMRDYGALSDAFMAKQERDPDDVSFTEPFYDSVASVLEEFYACIDYVEVSALTGENIRSLWEKAFALCAGAAAGAGGSVGSSGSSSGSASASIQQPPREVGAVVHDASGREVLDLTAIHDVEDLDGVD